MPVLGACRIVVEDANALQSWGGCGPPAVQQSHVMDRYRTRRRRALVRLLGAELHAAL